MQSLDSELGTAVFERGKRTELETPTYIDTQLNLDDLGLLVEGAELTLSLWFRRSDDTVRFRSTLFHRNVPSRSGDERGW